MRSATLVAATVLALGAAPAFAEAPPEALRISITGLRSDAGHVRCLVFARADGFPKDPAKASARAMSGVKKGRAECVFPGLAAGAYAVSFFHDEDDDLELDSNFLGIPKEGYGFGNDARGSMGPPDFAAAKVTYAGGPQVITLKTEY